MRDTDRQKEHAMTFRKNLLLALATTLALATFSAPVRAEDKYDTRAAIERAVMSAAFAGKPAQLIDAFLQFKMKVCKQKESWIGISTCSLDYVKAREATKHFTLAQFMASEYGFNK